MISFEFDEKYFENEVRCGFEVSSLMKRCWAMQLKVLSDFDAVCSRHGLKWFAFCGTLLGAVRHGGFIPWDDDLDVCMLRGDYNMFLHYARTEMKDYYVEYNDALDPEEKRAYDFMGITRINNTFKAEFDDEYLSSHFGFPYAAGLDVYPLDYLPKDKETLDLITQVYAFCINTAFKYKSVYWTNYAAPIGNYEGIVLDEAYESIRNVTGIGIDKNGDILKQLNSVAENLAAITKSKDSESVACMGHLIQGHNLIFPKDAFKSRMSVPFESGTVYVPYGFNEVLSRNYGKGYITPANRSPHDYPYYKQQERWALDYVIKNPEVRGIITEYYISDVYDENPGKKKKLDEIYGKNTAP